MANLSNINNKFIVTSETEALIGITSWTGVGSGTLAAGLVISGNTSQFILDNPSYNHFTMYSAGDSNIYNVFGSSGNYLIGTGNKDTSSWSEKMRIDSSGNATFSGNVRISKTDATLEINNSTASLTNADLYISVEDTGQADVRQYGAYPLVFWTNNTERMRITSGGQVQVGYYNTARGGANTTFMTGKSGTTYLELNGGDVNGEGGILFADGAGGNYGLINYSHVSDIMQFYTDAAERMRIGITGVATHTMGGGSVVLDNNGMIESKQALDVATAGGRLTGKSNRGTLASIHLEQTATSADGGEIYFATCPTGSTSPVPRIEISSAGLIMNYYSYNTADTFFGYDAGLNLGAGYHNTLYGYYAGRGITTGTRNTIIGSQTAYTAAANMNFSVVIGYSAARYFANTSDSNVIIGDNAASVSAGCSNCVIIGQAAGVNTTGGYNTFVGGLSGELVTTGDYNTAIGYGSYSGYVGYANTGNDNTALGYYAMGSNNVSGSDNTAVGLRALYTLNAGANNVAVGVDALKVNQAGSSCVAIGTNALKSDASVEESVAVGENALMSQTSGRNHAFGFHALQDLISGNYNTAVGGECMENLTDGSENVGMGAFALRNITSSSNNVGIGYKALYTQTSGNSNVGIGHQAGEFISSATYTTLIGAQCGSLVTTNNYNTMMGYYTGRNTTYGENNAFFGALAGRYNTGGNRNTYIGCQSVDNSSPHTGNDNVVVGFGAAQNISSGYQNILIGKSVASNLTTGVANIGIGIDALNSAGDGTGNIAIGYSCMGGGAMSGTGKNIGIGDATLYNITSGINNICIGWNAGRSGFSTPQSMGAIITASNEIQIGNESHTNAMVQIVWTINSDGRDKTEIKELDLGLEFVNKLKPVTYKWDKRSKYEDLTPDGTHTEEELQIGFLAQDIIELEKEYGYTIEDKTNLATWESEDKWKVGIKHANLIPSLVKAIQELKADNDTLKARIETLENK